MKLFTRCIAILILALIGIFLSAYLLIQHYTESPSVCNVDEYWSCDRVNRGPYSEIYFQRDLHIPINGGIPIAGIGLFGFLTRLILIFLVVYGKRVTQYFPKPFSKLNEMQYITLFAIGGTLYGIYLTYLEVFVIKAVCPFCVLAFAVNTLTIYFSGWIKY